jgi:hypothetical protein
MRLTIALLRLNPSASHPVLRTDDHASSRELLVVPQRARREAGHVLMKVEDAAIRVVTRVARGAREQSEDRRGPRRRRSSWSWWSGTPHPGNKVFLLVWLDEITTLTPSMSLGAW